MVSNTSSWKTRAFLNASSSNYSRIKKRKFERMSTQASVFALKNTLSEVKNVCPEMSRAFILRENGDVVAEDQTTNPEALETTQDTFRALINRAGIIGGLDSATFRGERARASVVQLQGFYVANVASNGADEKTITNLMRVMIPATLKLIQEFYPSRQKSALQTRLEVQDFQVAHEKPASPVAPEISQPEPEFSEFTVDNVGFGSFLYDAESAHIDPALVAQWREIYGDQPITRVILENTAFKRSLTCPFKAFRESRYEGKGLVLLSENLRNSLRVQKGAKILIKPKLGNLQPSSIVEEELETPKEKPAELQGSKSPESAQTRYTDESKPDVPVDQFMVETLGSLGGFGLRGNPECVRVDRAMIAKWTELFGEKEIKQVVIEETSTGRRLTCDFKPIKDSSLEGKGIIQLPEKMQKELQTKKGALVIVKPVVE
jgi:hypothetical protein